MIELYYWPMPNGHKVTMLLEEAGLDYTIHPVDISAGDQFKPDFLSISPNNRMPAIVDTAPADGGEPASTRRARSRTRSTDTSRRRTVSTAYSTGILKTAHSSSATVLRRPVGAPPTCSASKRVASQGRTAR